MNEIPVLNLLPEKFRGLALFVVALLPWITRAFYSLKNGGGIAGLWRAVMFGTNVPPTGQAPVTDLTGTAINSQPSRPGALAILLSCFGIAFAPLLFTTGCQSTPEATAYNTLASIRVAVDAAEKVYSREVAAGRVTAAQQESADEKIVQFHAAYLVAVRAARTNYTTLATPDLQRLADALINLIYTFTNEPAP
jgi:hypothetical protein